MILIAEKCISTRRGFGCRNPSRNSRRIVFLEPASIQYEFHNQSGYNIGRAKIPTLQIVAAENFWGSLISQLGGTHVHVVSIVTDPNADPHEYESNSANAIAISDASFVIVNGAGYDTWALSLIAADNNPNQKVLNVQELIGQSIGANPHFWYSPYYVNDTVNAMYTDLLSIDPANAAYYQQQYVALECVAWSV